MFERFAGNSTNWKNSALSFVQNNIIPARKIMGQWRILKEDVIEYILHA